MASPQSASPPPETAFVGSWALRPPQTAHYAEAKAATRAAGLLAAVGIGVGMANLAFNVLVARAGGAVAYGGIGALLTLGTGGSFLASGLQYAVARRAATSHQSGRHLLASVARRVAPWVGGSLLATPCAPALSSLLHIGDARPALLSILLFAAVIAGAAPMGVLIGRRRFRALALVTAVSAVVRLTLTIPLSGMRDPTLSALVASLLAVGVGLVAATFLAIGVSPTRRAWLAPGAPPIAADAGSGVMADGLLSGLLAGLVWAVGSSPILFGQHFLPRTVASNLAALELMASGGTLVIGAVTTAFFSAIARRRDRGIIAVGLVVTLVLALSGGGAMVVAVPVMMPRLYGAAFASTSSLVLAVAFTMVLVAMSNYLLWVCRARQRELLWTASACVLALCLEAMLGAVWHSSVVVLGLEPGIALLGGMAGALAGRALFGRRVPVRRGVSAVGERPFVNDGGAAR